MHRAHSMEESKYCDGNRLQRRLGGETRLRRHLHRESCARDDVLAAVDLRHVATIGQTTCKKTRCTYKTSMRARMQPHLQWGRGGHAHKVQRGPRENV